MATERKLRLFGHNARRSSSENRHYAIAAAIQRTSSDWKRPPGRPSRSWLREAVEEDPKPLNFGLL